MNIEPEKHEFQGRDGKWCTFIDDAHYQNTVEDGSWPIRALYTEAQMRQLGEACAAVCYSIAKGGSMNIEPVASIVPCYTPSGKRVALNTRHQGLPIGTVLYTEAQLRQLVEACAVAAWNTGMDLHMKQHDSREVGSAGAAAIRELIKELLS